MTDAVTKLVENYISSERYSGIEWRIAQRDDILSEGRLGYANFEQKSPIPEDAVYRIYSMTKPIISVLALMLIERGRLHLYDPLLAYDPRFRSLMVLRTNGAIEPANSPITVEHLLTHRAGFSYEFLLGCPIAPYYRAAGLLDNGARPFDDVMGALAELPLAFHPGSDWRYSVATDVLAHVIERATGERIDDLLKKHIFDPLGMSETTFCLKDDQLPRLMAMYGNEELGRTPALKRGAHELRPLDVSPSYPMQSKEFRRGGHGLYSTLSDYCAFVRMLLSGESDTGERLLSERTLSMMHANRLPQGHAPLRIGDIPLPGYGWNLTGRVMVDVGQALSTYAIKDEFGWAGAAGTYFWVDPKAEITGVIMTQFIRSNFPLSDDMMTVFYGAVQGR
ncbi:MAG: class A beta-lactamase-related serine hydrolase [Rhodobacteraceae bacterium]|nr:class A beta-lactamase-related serine hydrolase [Paracoccaceae bacterium]